MSIELAVALAAIAARTIVTEVMRGGGLNSDDWAIVGGQVTETLIMASNRQPDSLQRQVLHLGAMLNAVPAREFDQHMAAGRRHLRDLPVGWRSKRERRELIRDARAEFVRAYAVAETMPDAHRQALADVAIAGCWLWVPSPKDVRKTAGHARRLLEERILAGAYNLTGSYRDVLAFSKACGEQPTITGTPIVPHGINPPAHGARLGVQTVYGAWVRCAGVEVRVVDKSVKSTMLGRQIIDQGAKVADNRVVMAVRNTRTEGISFCLHGNSAIAQLSENNVLANENRVAPGEETYVFLEPCPSSTTPVNRTIGFVLPSTQASVAPWILGWAARQQAGTNSMRRLPY